MRASSRSKSGQAFTLVELMIAMTMLSVFSLMCVRALSMAFHGMRLSSEKTESRRQVLTLYKRLQAELSIATRIPEFDSAPGSSATPVNALFTETSPLQITQLVSAPLGSYNLKRAYYYFDPASEGIFRKEDGYAARKVVERVKVCRVSADKAAVSKSLSSGTTTEYLPVRVNLEVEVATIREPIKAVIELTTGAGGV
jgi:prepilin-type N-terminal cleavage/methylation domain-containing protein